MTVEHEFISLEPRTPVSLRIPKTLAANVELYATEQGISKTDSYIHFLELGMLTQATKSDEDSIRRATVLLSHALNILQKQGDAK